MTTTEQVNREPLRARIPAAAHFWEFGFTPKLSEVSLRTLLWAALWMAIAYGPWLLLQEMHGDHAPKALLPVAIGFTPLALWAIYNYRIGLLLAIIAAPLLSAPPIPHFFTQGFGDLFAVCAVVGYLLRHPAPSEWRQWRREYIWLLLILAAAFLSLALSPVWDQQVRYGIKYGLAEIAGYCLAMAYLAILVHEVHDRLDIKTVLYAVAARTALTTNGAFTSTLSNPNHHASYLVAMLPLALRFYLRAPHRSWARRFAATAALFLVFFVQAALSRSGLTGLAVI